MQNSISMKWLSVQKKQKENPMVKATKSAVTHGKFMGTDVSPEGQLMLGKLEQVT